MEDVLHFVESLNGYLTMIFPDSVFIGIDPTSSHKSFTYAALDRGLNLVALSNGELEDVTAFAAGQRAALVAINAPAGVHRGLAREKLKKQAFTQRHVKTAEYRKAERDLRERGIAVTGTPFDTGWAPGWMQAGFALYRKLEELGFKRNQAESASHRLLETHPHACYCALAGSMPMPKPSIEGRLQRQLLLYEHGVKINDPMDFFEEITRYKMIKGLWPLDLLFAAEQLDALVAAFTAWMSAHRPEQVSFIGDEKEGQILLPVKELKERY